MQQKKEIGKAGNKRHGKDNTAGFEEVTDLFSRLASGRAVSIGKREPEREE